MKFEYKPDLPGFPVVWSPCKLYRYILWRTVRFVNYPKYIAWIGLNPSTATEYEDDNTIRRCRNYTRRWGYDAMVMLNLFAYRSTDPGRLRKVDDPIGKDNDRWLRVVTKAADKIVCCWGRHGKFLERQNQVVSMLRNNRATLCLLAQNQDGTPLHPLYAKGSLSPREWI